MKTHKEKYDEYQEWIKEHQKIIEERIERELKIKLKFIPPKSLAEEFA